MTTDSTVLQWDEDTVNDWLGSIGYPQYHEFILEHGISGDVLVHLDFDSLRDIGIASAGHRLDILKAIYRLKVENGIPIEPEHYVPLSEANEDVFPENTPLGRLMHMIGAQNERIRTLEHEVHRLQNDVMSFEEYAPSRPSGGGLHKQPSFKWARYGQSVRSPTKPMPEDSNGVMLQPQDSPRASPHALEHGDIHQQQSILSSKSLPKIVDSSDPIHSSNHPLRTTSNPRYPDLSEAAPQTEPPTPSRGTTSASGDLKDSRSRTNDDRAPDNIFQSFKVSLDDPCSKVLPAALKKYRITDDWRMYALFICYGNTERCLSLDEKPLLLFKRLKDAGKNPVFMLRHVRDIRAPITVANGKQTDKQSPPKKSDYTRDTRLHQTPLTALQPVSNKGYTNGRHGESSERLNPDHHPPADQNPRPTGNGMGHSDAVILSTGLSYAVAIYPYGADYDDEFDVTVGAMFVVIRRSKGWWQVQRDPNGSGAVDTSARKAWVPAGCLLETNVPPATAIAEANSQQPATPPFTQSLMSPSTSGPTSDSPILPSSIVSTSYPGIALMDWAPQGDHELELAKDDVLRVFKRYNHWSYVVKEAGRRGWVPSWLIGKIASSGQGSTHPPVTPATAMTNYDDDGPRNLANSVNGPGGFPTFPRVPGLPEVTSPR